MKNGKIVKSIQEVLGKDVKQTVIADVIDQLVSNIQTRVAAGETVTVQGLGSFSKRERKERSGRNPKTGEAIVIAAKEVMRFKARAFTPAEEVAE